MDVDVFSYVAMGVVGAQGIRAHAIAFATVARMYDPHPLWDQVIAALAPHTARRDGTLPAEAHPAEIDPPAAAPTRRARKGRAAEPVVVEPVAIWQQDGEFALVEPAVVEPVAVEPVAVEPVAVEPVAVEPVAVEPTTWEDGPSLQDALAGLVKREPVAVEQPPMSRADMEAMVRMRAKEGGQEGVRWLLEHVMCGNKYTRFAEVPDAVLQAALVVPREAIAA